MYLLSQSLLLTHSKDSYEVLESAARQLVLGLITFDRAKRRDWEYTDDRNYFDELVTLKFAKVVPYGYEATDLLLPRQQEILSARISLDVMAAKMGVAIPKKFSKPAPIKHSYKVKGSLATLRAFLHADESTNAVEYAALINHPLYFGKASNGATVYYDVDVHDFLGFPFFTGRNVFGDFNCVSLDYGLNLRGASVAKNNTRQVYIDIATMHLTREINKAGLAALHTSLTSNNIAKVSQAELLQIYLDQEKG